MVSSQLDRSILDLVEAKSFPPVVLKFFTLVSDLNADLSEVERTLSMDAVLSARVFKVANSPFFNRGRKAETLSRAVSLVGLNALRTVVLSSALHDAYSPSGGIEKKLWEHSLGVSLVASLIARETGLAEESLASTAGLFHDIGKILLKAAYPKRYEEMAAFIDGGSLGFHEAEKSTLHATHTSAGVLLARKWNLIPEYCLVIEGHHGGLDEDAMMPDHRRLVWIIRLADEICFYFGIGFKKKVDLGTLPFRDLGLTNTRFDELIWKVNETYEEYINSLSF